MISFSPQVRGGLGNPVFQHTGEIDSAWHLGKIYLDSEYTSSPFKVRHFENELYTISSQGETGGNPKFQDRIGMSFHFLLNKNS